VEGFQLCIDAKRWSNILGVADLLFCLPLSNGHLERVFSQMKFLKNDHCINLTENRLDQLVQIDCCGPPIDQWDPSNAISEWYKDKTRRVTTRGRSSKAGDEQDEKEHDTDEFSLDAWKTWLDIISGSEESESDNSDCDTEESDHDV